MFYILKQFLIFLNAIANILMLNVTWEIRFALYVHPLLKAFSRVLYIGNEQAC